MSYLKYFVLAGPTAVGKTEIAIRLAQELKTEIVGCDAFQIYEGLNLLTAKPASEQLSKIPHHLIGVLPLEEHCDAHKYATLARKAVASLNALGSVPLVVGGTGFYLQALEGSLSPLPPANIALRQALELVSTEDLRLDLKARDPVAFARIDLHNRRRIVRALEVCILSGKPFSDFADRTPTDPPLGGILLERPRAELVQRIDRRVDEMFERGVVEEIAGIDCIGATASQAIGFQAIRSLLAGEMDQASCREFIKQQTRSYAKRQMTWFRRRRLRVVPAESPVGLLASVLGAPVRHRGPNFE